MNRRAATYEAKQLIAVVQALPNAGVAIAPTAGVAAVERGVANVLLCCLVCPPSSVEEVA